MEPKPEEVQGLTDEQLINAAKTLAEHERHATVRVVTALAEIERRRLYRGQGCGTLYEYCVNVLKLSEDAASSQSPREAEVWCGSVGDRVGPSFRND